MPLPTGRRVSGTSHVVHLPAEVRSQCLAGCVVPPRRAGQAEQIRIGLHYMRLAPSLVGIAGPATAVDRPHRRRLTGNAAGRPGSWAAHRMAYRNAGPRSMSGRMSQQGGIRPSSPEGGGTGIANCRDANRQSGAIADPFPIVDSRRAPTSATATAGPWRALGDQSGPHAATKHFFTVTCACVRATTDAVSLTGHAHPGLPSHHRLVRPPHNADCASPTAGALPSRPIPARSASSALIFATRAERAGLA
jgi:hypothetical protein